MKKISILILVIGVIITIYCITYFKPFLNAVDSDTMTVNPHKIRTAEWPLFIGLLTTFVGICFYFVGVAEEKKAKR